jgi:acyl phosphate:glycerol-3-phosphate acyltransferase
VALATRFVSVASLTAAVALPAAVWLTKDSVALGVVTTALGVLAIAKHRANIGRLLKGTESRISFKSKGTT